MDYQIIWLAFTRLTKLHRYAAHTVLCIYENFTNKFVVINLHNAVVTKLTLNFGIENNEAFHIVLLYEMHQR